MTGHGTEEGEETKLHSPKLDESMSAQSAFVLGGTPKLNLTRLLVLIVVILYCMSAKQTKTKTI